MTWFAALGILLVSALSLPAQPAPLPAGHWEGAIQVSGQELKIEVDLASSGGTWQGAIAIPAQNLRDFPLSEIVVLADAVAFAMEGVPGKPRFKGTLDREKQTMTGDFMQGEGTMAFSLSRTGEAKLEPPPSSTPIAKELAGEWSGALDANGQTLRLVLKLTAEGGSPGSGVLVSVDQGGVEIPITAVIQDGTRVTLVVQRVAGRFEGELKEGQLTGTWTQGPGTLPLVFTRAK